jgi:CheY-like chemotaxis protein
VVNIHTPPPLVLVVEDEWLLRLELATALEEAGFRVLEADSGEQALALLVEVPSLALLVTDIRLGGAVCGWDVADACRAREPFMPVVYVSASAPDAARQLTLSKFFTKPIRLNEVLPVCAALVAF